MSEIQQGLGQKQLQERRPPVKWKIVSIHNEEQTITVLFPAQFEEKSQKTVSEENTKA
jgi:hypothetical protein